MTSSTSTTQPTPPTTPAPAPTPDLQCVVGGQDQEQTVVYIAIDPADAQRWLDAFMATL